MAPGEVAAARAGGVGVDDGAGSDDSPGVDEPVASFQTRFGDALIDFNICMADEGHEFVGIPGESANPATLHPGYLQAVTSCSNETGVSELLDQQRERSAALTSLERQRTNEERRTVYNCLIDRGWELGELEPNVVGVLVVTGFPPGLAQRQEAFSRDLDLCGWNEIEFG